MNKLTRAKAVIMMDELANSCNDENIVMSWLSLGVADGDITKDTKLDDENLESYYEDDKYFAELMDTFLRCMARAYKKGGLYIDKVVSKEIDY